MNVNYQLYWRVWRGLQGISRSRFNGAFTVTPILSSPPSNMADRLRADATSGENKLGVTARYQVTGTARDRVFAGEYDEKLTGENSSHP